MNFLPKIHSQFGEKEYWDKFFTKRGTNAFEWYGEYSELCLYLQKYVRPSDEILMVGCGNSKLSADLYDVGYFKITNIDVSDVIIKQMKEKNADLRPKMKWNTMDVTKMSFDDCTHNVVLDKGTLDALMPDDSKVIHDKISKMFAEIDRILKPGSRYICISLLQLHILKFLLAWFFDKGWMIRIHRCPESENTEKAVDRVVFPVFMVVCTKLKKIEGQKPIMELCLGTDKPERISNFSDMIKAVQSLQQYAFVRYHLSKKDTKEDIFVELYTPESKEARYLLYIVDSKVKAETKFAIFIVPQGRETEWLFNSFNGRKHLAENTKCQRLIVVHLSRNHTYNSFDTVKAELSSKVMELAPQDLPSSTKIPFWSLGEDLGIRNVLCNGRSDISGDFIVEDVAGEDKLLLRRLIFRSNQNVIQSEARLKLYKKKGKKKYIIDHHFLACEHHHYMLSGLAFLSIQDVNKSRILIIGLGGGGLPMFLRTHFPNAYIEVVDIDPEIVQVAHKWFGFVQDEKLKVHVEDGIKFLEKYDESAPKYDVILLDVDSKDSTVGMSCPPQIFVEKEVLSNMKAVLRDDGISVINLVCRDLELKRKVVDDIKEIFPALYSYQIEQEVNQIVYCSRMSAITEDYPQNIQTRLKFWHDIKKKCSDMQFDIEAMVSNLKIL